MSLSAVVDHIEAPLIPGSLEERKALEWHDSVDVIHGDMRTIAIPELADILVSELLGSFGDNELSPECLDGAMRFLRRESGHMIRAAR